MMNMTQRGPHYFRDHSCGGTRIFSAFWFVSGVVEPVVARKALPNQKVIYGV